MRLLGAIGGDMLGSAYEGKEGPIHSPEITERSRFTDDTVLLLAVATALMDARDMGEVLQEFYQFYPGVGYGNRFSEWAWVRGNPPYQSMGNGSAMRAPACGWVANDKGEALALGERSALPTHDHIEGIKGAQAVSIAIYLLREGHSKETVSKYLWGRFNYTWRDYIQPSFEPGAAICPVSMPLALQAFMLGDSWEEVVSYAVRLGGDTDTNACIAGALAEVIYPVPKHWKDMILARLDDRLRQCLVRFAQWLATRTGSL